LNYIFDIPTSLHLTKWHWHVCQSAQVPTAELYVDLSLLDKNLAAKTVVSILQMRTDANCFKVAADLF